MSEAVPEVLFQTKRGLCPSCGSPLSLDTDEPTVTCGFCGNQAVLERRLRMTEPDVPDAPLRLYFDGESAQADVHPAKSPWLRSERFRQAVVQRTVCPGCGESIAIDEQVTVHRCGSCGTDCRIERRLRAVAADASRGEPRPRSADERRGQCANDDLPLTEQLVYRIVHERDAATRLLLAKTLDTWAHINATLARLMPAVLRAMRGAEPALQYALARVVCKLLCHEDRKLRHATLSAAEPYLFDAQCPRQLVFELGMGDAICLKPLLDGAEFAARRGDIEFACAALLAVNYVFERNYDQHAIMGQVLLYRMLYLSGPVLAFAMITAQGQRGIGFRYDAPTLLRFIDDCAAERPALLGELDKCFYVGRPADAEQWRRRRAEYDTLRSDAARSAALRHYLCAPQPPQQYPPHVPTPDEQAANEALYEQMAAFLVPLLDEPALADAADRALRDMVDTPRPTPRAVHDMMAAHHAKLPAEVKRTYLRVAPDTTLFSYNDLPYWQGDPKPPMNPQFEQAMAMWNEGLHRAVDANTANRQAFEEQWKTIQGREVEVFA